MSLPKVTFVGNVVTEPTLTFTPSGKPVAKVRAVAKDRVRGPQGEWSDGDPTFLTIEVWGRPAENAVETLRVGSQVMAEGRLEVREYERNDGTKGTAVTIKADTVGVGTTFKAYVEGGAQRSQGASDDVWGTAPQDDAPPF
jgi:single-strand DNA-binding protein